MTASTPTASLIDGAYPASAHHSMVSAATALTGGDPSIRGVVSPGTATPGRECYALTPPWRPRLLVPAGYPNHAKVSVAEFGHHRSELSNLAGAAVSQLMSNATTPALVLHFDGPSGPIEITPLSERLAGIFGVDRVHLAVRAVLDRPNAKPVVIVMSRDAGVLGFCKVGWDDHTRRLVVHERQTLDRVRDDDVPELFVPDTLFSGSWSGLELLVTRPVATNGRHLSLPELVAVACRLGERQSVGVRQLGDCERMTMLRKRVSAVSDSAPPRIAEALHQSLASVDRRWSEQLMDMGREHGDFVTTNAAPSDDGRGTVVWDWERSVDESPVGLDAAHAVVAQLVKNGDRFDRLIPVLSDALVAAQGPADAAPVLALLDLTEMVLRHEEARLANLSCDDPGYGACLSAMLRFFPA